MQVKHNFNKKGSQNKVETKNLVQYLNSRLKPLQQIGFTHNLNAFGNLQKCFSSDQYGNIKFAYLNLDGNQYRFGGKEYEWNSIDVPCFTAEERAENRSKPYFRKRFKTPFLNNGKLQKYSTPKGATAQPYFTAFYQCFVNPKSRLFQSADFSKVVIVEGEFKAWALCLLGVPTIGISGIHNAVKTVKDEDGKVIDAILLPELEAFLSDFEVSNIIQLQDTDAMSNSHNQDRAASFAASVKYMFTALSKLNISHTYIHSTTTENKGIDDLLIALPPQQRKKAIKQLLKNYEVGIFKHKTKYFNIYNATESRLKAIQKVFYRSSERSADKTFEHSGYLSDLHDQNLTFREYIEANNRLLIQFGTGGGKTYFAEKQAKRDFEKFGIPTILIAPLNAIVEQQGQKNDVPYFTAAIAQDQVRKIEDDTHFLVCNYDSIENLVISLKNQGIEKYIIALDEQHELINSVGYRPKKSNAVWAAMNNAFRVYAYSATPFLCGFESFKYLKVVDTQKESIKLTLAYAQSLYKTALAVCNPYIGKVPIMCLFNSKDKIRDVTKYYESQGFNVAQIYSEDGIQENEAYQYIVKKEKFPPNVDILLCTSKIATGLNVYAGRNIKLVYVENSKIDGVQGLNKRLLEQFHARIRDTKNVIDCTIIVKDGKGGNGIAPSHYVYEKNLREFTEKANNYNADSLLIGGGVSIGHKSNFSHFIDIFTVDGNDNATVNKLHLSFLALQHEIKNTNSDDLFFDEMGELVALGKEENQKANQVKKQVAKDKKNIQNLIYKELAYDLDSANEAANKVANKTLSTGLRTSIKNTLGNNDTTEVYEDNYLHEWFVKILSIIILKFCKLGLDFKTATNLIFQKSVDRKGIEVLDEHGNDTYNLKSTFKINEIFDILNMFKLLHSETGALSKKEQYQARKYLKLIEAIEQAFDKNEGKLSRNQISAIVRRKYNRNATNSSAMKLVKSLLNLDYEKDENSKCGFYQNLGRWGIKMVDNCLFSDGGFSCASIISKNQTVKGKNRTDYQAITTPIINPNACEKVNHFNENNEQVKHIEKVNLIEAEMDFLTGLVEA
ncbi:MAG: DUF3854 domain-containing protein [Polaribacter sp.]